MALIKCSECGKEISDKARKCPSCGFVFDDVRRVNAQERDEKFERVIKLENNKKVNEGYLNVENQTKKVNKKLIIGIIIGLVFIVMILILALWGYIRSNTTVNYNNMKDQEKIAVLTEPFGDVVGDEEETILIDPELFTFYQNAKLFGYEGKVVHQYTREGKKPPYIIDMVDWISNQQYTEEDFSSILNSVKELYGNNFIQGESYDNITGVYEWKEVEGYARVVCGKDDNEKIVVRWIAKTS